MGSMEKRHGGRVTVGKEASEGGEHDFEEK